MPAKIDIPLVFTVDPEEPEVLKKELERLASGVYKYTQDAAKLFIPNPPPAPSGVLAFGMVTRIAAAVGDSILLQLPRPDVQNGGQSLFIKRETTGGTVTVKAIGCLINGRATKLLPAAPGLYQIFFDATNYYSNPQLAVDWAG